MPRAHCAVRGVVRGPRRAALGDGMVRGGGSLAYDSSPTRPRPRRRLSLTRRRQQESRARKGGRRSHGGLHVYDCEEKRRGKIAARARRASRSSLYGFQRNQVTSPQSATWAVAIPSRRPCGGWRRWPLGWTTCTLDESCIARAARADTHTHGRARSLSTTRRAAFRIAVCPVRIALSCRSAAAFVRFLSSSQSAS